VLLGLGFVVFGSNAFLHFIPMPPLPQTLAGDFTRVFIASGYAYVIGALQVIGGFFLLIGRFVPLGLTILGGDHRQHFDLSRVYGTGRFSTCTRVYRPRVVFSMAVPGGFYSIAQAVKSLANRDSRLQIN